MPHKLFKISTKYLKKNRTNALEGKQLNLSVKARKMKTKSLVNLEAKI
jgi:hypothetical protein